MSKVSPLDAEIALTGTNLGNTKQSKVNKAIPGSVDNPVELQPGQFYVGANETLSDAVARVNESLNLGLTPGMHIMIDGKTYLIPKSKKQPLSR